MSRRTKERDKMIDDSKKKGKEGKYVFNRRIDKKDVWSG
jgi:hypothetical protein